MKILLFSLSLMIAYTTNAGAAPAGMAADTFLNVAYGNNAMQRMDIYLPVNRSQAYTPSLILLHGGGWTNGSRHSLAAYIDSFKRRLPQYALFNIDYRLVSASVHVSEQQKDIKSAVDFISSHTDAYSINAAKFVMVGVSAGAHLALLQSYKNTSPKIAGVIDFFGPADLSDMYNNPWNPMIPHLMESTLGGTPITINAYRELSPVTYITEHTPPTLIFHGRQDRLVDISQSQSLQKKLDNARVKNKLVVYADAGHGWWGNTLSNSFDTIELFLKQIN